MKELTRAAGWIALAGGAAWGVFNALSGGGWVLFLFWVVLALVLAAALFGIGEVLERQEAQEALLLRLQKKLEGEEVPDPDQPRNCRHYGTPLPPGGHACPTCHHYNQ